MGVAKLVSRYIWDVETGRSSRPPHTARTIAYWFDFYYICMVIINIIIMRRKKYNGYWIVYIPKHPHAFGRASGREGWVMEHVYVIVNDIGRPLRSDECVHHLDGDILNNHITNLVVMLHGSHARLHNYENNKDRRKREALCVVCKAPMPSARNTKFCSLRCKLSNDRSRIDGVSMQDVFTLAERHNYKIKPVAIELGMSDNGFRKWLKTRHNINNSHEFKTAMSKVDS